MNFVSYPDDVLKDGQDEDGYLPKPEKLDLSSKEGNNYYEFLRFSEENTERVGKEVGFPPKKNYRLYTNLNDIKIVNLDPSNLRGKIITEKDLLSDRQQVIAENREFWLDNLDEASLFRRLTDKEIADYKLVTYKNRTKTTLYAIVPFVAATTVGLTTYNFAMSHEVINILVGSITAGLTWNVASLALYPKFDLLLGKEYQDATKLNELKKENKLYNYNQILALYYCILYESLKDKPNIERIQLLNETRKDLLASKKTDEFTRDVDNYIRVRS